jgi:hypothetical protein
MKYPITVGIWSIEGERLTRYSTFGEKEKITFKVTRDPNIRRSLSPIVRLKSLDSITFLRMTSYGSFCALDVVRFKPTNGVFLPERAYQSKRKPFETRSLESKNLESTDLSATFLTARSIGAAMIQTAFELCSSILL